MLSGKDLAIALPMIYPYKVNIYYLKFDLEMTNLDSEFWPTIVYQIEPQNLD